ncbi:MAG: polyprenyl synthetase family protein [Candidatus Omnitrophota bacterium]|nr:polyprenyl synthetase family protein [Candidatus Omnitrophota bacterium]
MDLKQIYQPILEELKSVEKVLELSLNGVKSEAVKKVNRFLLESTGKRLRPAMVILSAKATVDRPQQLINSQLIKIATAMELIHMASLIHDDVIDHSSLRHNKPTINRKWGNDVSIALGDYLYSIAFELISNCGNPDISECISSATKNMCEGELLQVCERGSIDLLRQRYIIMVKKKTASLFAASCQSGAMLVNQNKLIENALKGYGLNFGIAFQIVDDCLDLIGEKAHLGKKPGADFKVGEITLPLLNLISQEKDKESILSLVKKQDSYDAFKKVRQRFINSEAFLKTKSDVNHYIKKARNSLERLNNSCFKQSLFALVDFMGERVKL